MIGFAAAVVDRQLLEIGQDGERQLGGPGVAAQLVRPGEVVSHVDGGFFGLHKELARPADAEGVIRRLGGPAHLDRILVDHVLVGLGVALAVGHIPAQRLEERVQELAAQLGFVVMPGAVFGGVIGKALDEGDDRAGAGMRPPPGKMAME